MFVMGEKAGADDIWSHAGLWADCVGDGTGSLLNIPDSEHMLHIVDDGNGPEQKFPGKEIPNSGQKEFITVPDPLEDADIEPPSKLQATSKLDSQGAKTKAFREKQRRAQLNNRYTELAALIDPGKPAKTDRNLILDEAVRVINQLRMENNQLKQLNKLLEERVQEQEAPRGQALYQSYLMSHSGHNPARTDGASTSSIAQLSVPADSSAASDIMKHTIPNGHVHTPAQVPQDPSALAVSMMNVAMQLLQSRPGNQPVCQPAPVANSFPVQNTSQWQLQGPPMPNIQNHTVPSLPQANMGHPFPEGKHDTSAAHPSREDITSQSCMNLTGQDESKDLSARVSTGMNPQMFSQQCFNGYNFPFAGGVNMGWPSHIVDPARDSKLRPPAA